MGARLKLSRQALRPRLRTCGIGSRVSWCFLATEWTRVKNTYLRLGRYAILGTLTRAGDFFALASAPALDLPGAGTVVALGGGELVVGSSVLDTWVVSVASSAGEAEAGAADATGVGLS